MFKPASQAKKEILEAKSEKANSERVVVADAIEKMIEEEKTSFYLYKSLMPSVKKELEDSGYNITESSHMNEYCMTVSIMTVSIKE